MSVDGNPRGLGRYVLFDQIAAGGMATVHFGRMHGAVGFTRVVAIKRLHPNYANDPQFVQMFLDEARLAARLDHPNVVSTLDVVADETEVFLVMEYVHGESLHALMPRRGAEPIPPPVASAIVCGLLEGLHAAHETRGDHGEPLEIVHRDVSPHNVLVGVDGVARVFDFGIAKAASNTTETREGVIKGKVTYMAPEQIHGEADRRTDVYAAGVILWELLAGRRRHAGERNDSLFLKLARNELEPASPLTEIRDDVSAEVDAVIARATDPDPAYRFATARDMAVALEDAVAPAPARSVSEWLQHVAASRIERTASVLRRIESDAAGGSSEPLLVPPARTGSTGSMHVVTASIPRTASIDAPSPDAAQAGVEPAPSGRQRSWAAPAALLGCAVVLALVGLRAYGHRPAVVREVAEDVAHAPPPIASLAASVPAEAITLGASASSVEAVEPVGIRRLPPPPATTRWSAPRAPRPMRAFLPPPQPKPAPREVAPAAPARVEAPAATATTKPSCENPFVIGSDGIRQIKPECL